MDDETKPTNLSAKIHTATTCLDGFKCLFSYLAKVAYENTRANSRNGAICKIIVYINGGILLVFILIKHWMYWATEIMLHCLLDDEKDILLIYGEQN